AAFFAEVQRPLFSEIAQITDAQPGYGASPRAGVGENAEHGAITQADDMTDVERTQEFAHLLDADLGCGTVKDSMFDAAHGSEGIESDRMPHHEAVEEVAQRRERLVLGGRGAPELTHIVTGKARSDLAEFYALLLTPGEEPRHGAPVSALRVGVIYRCLEKL